MTLFRFQEKMAVSLPVKIYVLSAYRTDSDGFNILIQDALFQKNTYF